MPRHPMEPVDGLTRARPTDRLLDEALQDGVRIALLGAATDGANHRLRARLLQYDGGRLIGDARGELDLRTGECNVDETLREALGQVASPPHVLVIWGGAARQFLVRAATIAARASHRLLDLRRAVLALRPPLPARASGEALLAAMGVGGVANEESAMDDRVGELLWAVLREAQERGWSWNELFCRASRPRSWVASGAVSLRREDLERLPQRPAVYRLLDASRHVIYIGQTGNLRRRMAEHLRPTDSPTPKTLELARRVRAIEYREVGSVLEARLYEDRWIRRWRPLMNKVVEIRPDHSRHPRSLTPIAIVAASVNADCAEIFAWRPASGLWQLRLRVARPPSRRLRTLWEVITARRAAMPRASGMVNWGRIGAEIAHRMFEAHHRRWVWLRPDSFPTASAWLAAVLRAAEDAARAARESTEYRWVEELALESAAGPG